MKQNDSHPTLIRLLRARLVRFSSGVLLFTGLVLLTVSCSNEQDSETVNVELPEKEERLETESRIESPEVQQTSREDMTNNAAQEAGQSIEFSDTSNIKIKERAVALGGGGGGGTYGARGGGMDLDGNRPEDLPTPQQPRVTLSEMDPRYSSKLEESSKRHRTNASGQQKSTWKRSELTPHAARVKIGDEETLPMKGMNVRVKIDGFRARVLIDQLFLNDRNQQLEGTFQLRLPNEARPHFLAFGQSTFERDLLSDRLAPAARDGQNIAASASMNSEAILKRRKKDWENVKVARVVPREEASRAYKETVRQEVDPALMEWSGAGVFRSRVFPLQPNKLHRVVVGYDVNLLETDSDWLYRLTLPEDVPHLQARVAVNGFSRQNVEVSPEPSDRTANNEFVFRQPDDRQINIRLRNPSETILTGRDPETGPYFATRFHPDLPSGNVDARPGAVFLLDTSLSSRPDRFNVWLNLMKAILKQNREQIDRFNVLMFDVEARWWKSKMVRNTTGNVESALDRFRTTVLEGATDLENALQHAVSGPPEMKVSGASGHDLFLLSDGSPTWGRQDRKRFNEVFGDDFSGRLFAYQTGMSGTDVRTLRHLAGRTGGAVFSVTSEHELPEAANAHRTLPWTIEEVSVDGGTDLLMAGDPDVLYPGQSVLLTGRGEPGANTTIRMTLSQGNRTHEVTVSPSNHIASGLAPRTYGQVAVNRLQSLASGGGNPARPYAMHFRVTGKSTSLLMLESEEDYERYDLQPESYVQQIKQNPVRELVRHQENKNTSAPDASFFELVEHIKSVKDRFSLPDPLMDYLKSRSDRFFDVEAESLSLRLRSKEQVPATYREHLSDGSVSYDPVYREARRRTNDGRTGDAVRAVSSLIEQNPGHTGFLQDTAYTLMAWDLNNHAYRLLLRSVMKRPQEPHAYLAIARLMERTGQPVKAMSFYEIVLNGRWSNRFGDFSSIARAEYHRMLNTVSSGKVPDALSSLVARRKKETADALNLKQTDLGVRIMWNTDDTDVDLHVTEPTGEECYYENPNTDIGGHITSDVTEGYGPERYTITDAKQGTYRIRVKYYSGSSNRVGLRTRVFAEVYRRGPDGELTVQRKTATLDKQKEFQELSVIRLSGSK